MDATVAAVGGVVINILLGGVIWFMKNSYNEIKDQVRKQQDDLERVKDTYFKKEDFREFKNELWVRLDKMEKSWSEKLNELRQ
jgi:hypothetical protein